MKMKCTICNSKLIFEGGYDEEGLPQFDCPNLVQHLIDIQKERDAKKKLFLIKNI
jgi:hypothetical protein